MKKLNKIVALALAVPLSIALAACSGSSGSASTPPASAAGNKLVAWAWDPAFNIYALNEAAKIYQKDHPDFELEVVETPWDDLQTKLTTLAASGQVDEMPDIFLMQNNAFQKNAINYPDLFGNFKDSPVDFTEFPPAIVGYSVVDGVNYGMPFDSGTAITALRTDVLKEAGYTVDDFTDLTWSQYITKAEDILKKTGKPLLSGTAGSADQPLMMLQSAGASLFDESGNPTIANNEVLLNVIDVYVKLVETGVLTEVNSWDEYISTLVNAKVAGAMNGVWILGSIQTAKDQSGKWKVTNLPKLEGVEGATNYSANGGSSWAVSPNANRDLAVDFLASTFAGSTELYDNILESSGAVANWIPAGDSDKYAEPQEFFGGQAVFSLVVDASPKVPSNNTGVYYYEGRDAVSAAITKILNGTDPNVALEEAQKTVEFAMQ